MALLAGCCSACYVCSGASVDRNGLWCAQEAVSAVRWVRRRAWVHTGGGRMKLLGAEKVSSAHGRRFQVTATPSWGLGRGTHSWTPFLRLSAIIKNISCELLSNFLTLAYKQQQTLAKYVSIRHLSHMDRIKKNPAMTGFFIFMTAI